MTTSGGLSGRSGRFEDGKQESGVISTCQTCICAEREVILA